MGWMVHKSALLPLQERPALVWPLAGACQAGQRQRMKKITESAAPGASLIARFGEMPAHYVDAFYCDVSGPVNLAEYVGAFYTTPLFRAERLILRFLAKAPSSDGDVVALVHGSADRFAVWTVEGRRDSELLMADGSGRTKSWFHVAPQGTGTRIWFGSVVVPVEQRGKLSLGPVFNSLIGAHKVYSRLLLGSAIARLGRATAG